MQIPFIPKSSDKTYIFFRQDMFYPIELHDDTDAIANAEHNNGTLKVEDLNGRIVWELKTEEHAN